jgi:hypothetical protein
VGTGGNDLSVLFDGGFLKTIEIVEERLPFGLEALVLVIGPAILRKSGL